MATSSKAKHAASKQRGKGASTKKGGTADRGKRRSAVEEEPRVPLLTPWRWRVLVGVVLLALALFSFLCVFAPGGVGVVGRAVRTALAWLVGVGRFVVPFALLGGAMVAFWKKPEWRAGLLVAGVAVMCVSLLAMLQLSVPTNQMFTGARLSQGGGGGLVGAVIAWPLAESVGKVGAIIFLIAAFIVGLALAFEEQLKGFVKRMREGRAVPAAAVAAGEAGGEVAVAPTSAVPRKAEKAKVYPAAPTPAPPVEEREDGQLALKVKPERAGKYKLPPATILNRGAAKAFSQKSNEERKKAIEQTLSSMDVDAKVAKISKGPTVSLFEVEVGTGEKVRRVTELEQDIAYALGSPDIRIYSPIPGRQAIGIEVPNHIRDTVMLGDIIDRLGPPASHNLLTMAVGKDMSGEAVILDLAQLPHLLLAGSTGAGKSCCINCLICCLLLRCTPDQLRLIMIDPKFVEFTWYDGLPHLLCDVINEPEPAAKALLWAVREMDHRYQKLQKQKVVHIDDYNAIAVRDPELENMPKIVIVIDELGDLMIVARREVESSIARLTAKARAVGIHMIIATQRPSVDVITGVIKNNITARIAFQVASHADSRTILSSKGAEKLLGKGDMLLDPGNIPQPERVQGALIQQKEIELLTGYIREQGKLRRDGIDLQQVAAPVTQELQSGDQLLEEAAEFVVNAGEASASMLQTHLRVGYARARRLVFELADLGIVGPHEGSKSRKVLVTPEEFDEWKARRHS